MALCNNDKNSQDKNEVLLMAIRLISVGIK